MKLLFRPAWNSKNEKIAVEAVNELKDEIKLKRAATKARCWQARIAATEKLQKMYFHIVGDFQTTRSKERMRAAANLTNQDMLTDVAKRGVDHDVSKVAVEKLTSQVLLTDVAKYAEFWDVRLLAAEKLTDQYLVQEVYADIAKNAMKRKIVGGQPAPPRNPHKGHWQEGVRMVENLTDQFLLADVAKYANICDVRLLAADKLTDQTLAQEVYTEFAKDNNNFYADAYITEKLTNQVLLAGIAKYATSDGQRMLASEKLTDQTFAQEVYVDILKNIKIDTVNYAFVKIGERIVANLTNQDVLADVAKNGKWDDTCREAAEKLTDQALLADVAKYAKDDIVRIVAAKKLTDQVLLADVAKYAKDSKVRVVAAEKLTDQTLAQEVYVDILKNSVDYAFVKIGKRIVANLTNQDVLADVAKSDELIDTCREAAEKLTDLIFAQKVFADIAKNEPKDIYFVENRVIANLTDQGLLYDVAKYAKTGGLRFVAAERLIDQTIAQEIYANIAKNVTCGGCVGRELPRYTFPEEHYGDYIEVYINEFLREKAINMLTDQHILTEIANGDVAKFCYTWKTNNPHWTTEECGNGYDHYSVTIKHDNWSTHILDLRETAQKRMVELGYITQ